MVESHGTLKFGDILDCTNPCIEFLKKQLIRSGQVHVARQDTVCCHIQILLRKGIRKC